MRVTVVGLGYVGLVTATCLARLGQDVVGLEADEEKVRTVLDGAVPYYEPGLEAELRAQRAAGRLRVTTSAREAFADPEVVLICVGTPSDAAGRADLRYVLDVADTIARELHSSPVVSLRSTVPVGTTRRVELRLNETLKQRGFTDRVAVIANPEFLRTGRAVDDFLRPTRIVLGTTDWAQDADIARLRSLYQPLGAPLLVMDAESAELVKNAANAFLATKISFVNELANLCDATGASVDSVLQGLALDPRIGSDSMRPGLGYGGSCLPKDVLSLIAMGAEHGRPMELAKVVDVINRSQPIRYARLLEHELGDLTGKRIALLGLAFKPDTDDIRDSPSIALARALRDSGAEVVACDPEAGDRVRSAEPWLRLEPDALSAAAGADAVVLATEWPAYVTLDPADLAGVMSGSTIVDGRNVLEPARVAAAGLTYAAFGRASD
jgi:UDPglucose 6-dehydrogenase